MNFENVIDNLIADKQLTTSSRLMADIANPSSSIWISIAPLKDIITSKVALSRRGVPFNDSGGLLCSLCNNEPESSTNLFSSCKVTYSVWQLLYNCLTISVVLPQSPLQHYSHHSGLVSIKKGKKAWSIIWLAIFWAIWRHRDDVIFNKVRPSTKYILDTAKMNHCVRIVYGSVGGLVGHACPPFVVEEFGTAHSSPSLKTLKKT
ncbi:hypothetical protein Lal_00039890 [Lupinus albus]|nr:hypothetical protein Lal_00039890 [Lupinus albus]